MKMPRIRPPGGAQTNRLPRWLIVFILGVAMGALSFGSLAGALAVEPGTAVPDTDSTPTPGREVVPPTTPGGQPPVAAPSAPIQPLGGDPADLVTGFSLAAVGATTLLVGESFTVQWSITTNAATSVTLESPVVTVTIPDQCVASVNPSHVDLVVPTVSQDGGNFVVTFALSDLSGGQSYQVPIVVTTKDLVCPDQATVAVTAEVTDAGGAHLFANNASPVTFTLTTSEPRLTKTTPDLYGRYRPAVATSYGGWSDNGGVTLSADPSKLAWVCFAFEAGWTTFSRTGGRNLSSVVVRDALPPGAIFDAVRNPGWVLSSDSTYVEYTYSGSTYNSHNLLSLVNPLRLCLKFPGATTGQTLTNQATITANPVDPATGEKTYTASSQSQFQLVSNWAPVGVLTKTNGSSVYDVAASREEGAQYLVQLVNVATDAAMTFSVTDHTESSTAKPPSSVAGEDLDPRLYFDSLTFRMPSATSVGTRWAGEVDVLVCRGNAPPTLLETVTIPAGSQNVTVALSDGPSITCIEVRGHNGTTIGPLEVLTWWVNTKFRDPTVSGLDQGQSDRLYNSAYGSLDWVDGRTHLSASATTWDGLVEYAPYVWVVKNLVSPDQAVLGNVLQWSIGASVMHAVTGLTSLDNVTVIDLLPPGLEFVPGSSASVGEPVIENNYHNSGRQALIWHLGDTTATSSGTHTLGSVPFKTVVTAETTPGTNVNEAYVVWTGGDSVEPGNTIKVIDQYDLNNNGDTTDWVVSRTAPFDYIPPLALLTNKRVQGAYDSLYLATPQYGVTDLNNPTASYLLRFNNNSIQDVTYLTAIDTLPHLGDLTLSQNSSGQVVSRDSEFAVRLTGPVSAPPGFTVDYTVDSVAGLAAQALNMSVTWTPTPANWAAVTALRIKLDPGSLIAQQEVVDFIVDVQVPGANQALVGKSAFNSFATSVDAGAATFFESGLSELRLEDRQPHLVASKAVKPATRTAVRGGDTLTYTLTLDNSLGGAAASVAWTDDLSDVIDDAEVDQQSLLVTGPGVNGSFASDSSELTLTGNIPAGAMVTVSYQVTVKPDGTRGNDQLINGFAPSNGQVAAVFTSNPVGISPLSSLMISAVAPTVTPASGRCVGGQWTVIPGSVALPVVANTSWTLSNNAVPAGNYLNPQPYLGKVALVLLADTTHFFDARTVPHNASLSAALTAVTWDLTAAMSPPAVQGRCAPGYGVATGGFLVEHADTTGGLVAGLLGLLGVVLVDRLRRRHTMAHYVHRH